MKHRLIWLIAGLAVSILFVVFASQIFEFLYYEETFSNWMYEQGLYLQLALFIVLISWGMALIFYYGLSKLFVNFSCWYHWLIMLILTLFLAPGVSVYYLHGKYVEESYDYWVQCQSIGNISIALTALFFIIASFSMRWWSQNAAFTPIPR